MTTRVRSFALILLAGNIGSAADPVLEAIEARTAKFNVVSVKFTINEQTTRQRLAPAAPHTVTLHSTNYITLAGERIRVEDNHPALHVTDGDVVNSRVVLMFDGDKAKEYYPQGIGGTSESLMILVSRGTTNLLRNDSMQPLSAFVRGFDRRLSSTPWKELKPTGVALPINGVDCVEYALPGKEPTQKRFWFAPSRGHVLVRVRKENGAKVQEQVDVAYRNDGELGWAPESWTINRYQPNGELASAVVGKVTSLSIQQPPADSFDMAIPTGCLVYDQRQDKHYRAKADGTLSELDNDGNEVGNTVFQDTTPWYRQYWWCLASGLVLIGLLVLFALKRRGSTSNA